MSGSGSLRGFYWSSSMGVERSSTAWRRNEFRKSRRGLGAIQLSTTRRGGEGGSGATALAVHP